MQNMRLYNGFLPSDRCKIAIYFWTNSESSNLFDGLQLVAYLTKYLVGESSTGQLLPILR